MATENELKTILTAEDHASNVIEGVATELDSLEGKSAEIPLTATDDATKTIADIDKSIADLVKQKKEIRLTLDGDEATRELAKVDKQIEKLKGEKAAIKITADADQATKTTADVLRNVEKLDATTATVVLAIKAADVQRALEEVTTDLATLDGQQVDVEVRATQAAQLQGDLDQIEGKIKELNSTPVDIKTEGAARGLGEVNKSAESSRSALANMVGNSAQDLGQLGGIAGSSGVAIGQMAEYASDAALAGESLGSALSSMAMVAGPIAAMALAIQAVNSILGAMAKGQAATKAFDTKQVEQFTQAIKDGGDVVADYNKTLADTGQVLADTGIKAGPAWTKILPGVSDLTKALGLFGKFGDTIENILPTLNKAGVSAEIWTKIITSSDPVDAMNTLRAALDQTNISDDERSKILIAARAAQDNYADSTKNAAEVEKFFTDTTKQGTIARQDYTRAQDLVNAAIEASLDPTAKAAAFQERITAELDASKKAAEDLAAEQQKLTASAANAAATMRGLDWGRAAVEGAAIAMGQFTTDQFALANIAETTEEAYGALGATVKESGLNFDVATEAGRKNQDALEGVAQSLTAKLASAYDKANGNAETFHKNFDAIRTETLTRLQDQLGLTAEEAQGLADKMGLAAGDWKGRYELSGVEEARIKVELLMQDMDGIPDEVQTEVRQDVLVGDWEGALATLQEALGVGVTTPLHANTDPAKVDIETWRASDHGKITMPVATEVDQADRDMSKYAKKKQPPLSVAVELSADAAERQAEAFRSKPRTASVAVALTGQPAVDSELDTLTAKRTAQVVVEVLNLLAAERQLDDIVQPRRVPIDLFLRDVPTLQEILNRIGPVRVPFSVTNASARLNGNVVRT